MDTIVLTFLGMWWVPAVLFMFAGLVLVYTKGYNTSLDPEFIQRKSVKGEDSTGLLFLLSFMFPCLALVFYGFVLKQPISFVGGVVYVLFETCGSWLMYGIFTQSGTHSWFKVKEKHFRQQYSFNINFDDVEIGQYVVRTLKDDWYDSSTYRLQLKQVHMEKDLTGEYKVLQNVEEWGNSEFWTEDQIKDKLKEYFKARNLFYIDNESGFSILKVEKNKPKIIVIE
ncbi:hypothetical protein [Aeromonas phage 4L372XY]|uniref:Uncharacterized protein n=3 Tax=Plateaulakevirus TaxID=2843436 RepID=A0A5B9N4L7_9CAUD|nr:hypothetical protein HWC25_gp154 [Aeromonas phage 2L372D]YP_009846948.1 hypothetical protein HWC28_gp149 [Aeromonas phage 4L372XY]QDB74068.1 hypothetical protein 2L372D_154 [Aeromonas phage 2L372D]QEG08864.1 hypothetical protein [Aeromonas phage 4L372XY]